MRGTSWWSRGQGRGWLTRARARPRGTRHRGDTAGLTSATEPETIAETIAETSTAAENGFAVLEKVLALPVSTWRYSWEEPHVRHLGPMAQDWWAAFGLGGSDTTIACADANGVALVSIQALHRRLAELQRRVDALAPQRGEAVPPEGNAPPAP
ncbi:tail fiber domain-containing protein [Streptomyces mobaraensis]|uniref:tail fiber domain-containing protein n=1 Tax=Streptomyces mobaraensis TaxID=35621 RepID=UPI00332E7B72